MVHLSQRVIKQLFQHLMEVAVVQIEGAAIDLCFPAEIRDRNIRILLIRQQTQQSILDHHTGVERAAVGFSGFLFSHREISFSEQLD